MTYQYNALPFGLATAPRVFTKLLKPVLAHLRAKGLRLVAYLDDILLIGKDKADAELAYHQAKQLLEDLGFVINREKSQSELSNTMHRVSGIHGQLHLNDIHTANSKGEGSKEQVQASSKPGEADDTLLGTYHRCVNSNPPCDSPGTSTLSRSSSAKDQRASPPPLIRIDDNIGETECGGFELVDQQCGDHQWETNSSGTTRHDNRIRCFQYRMGSLLEQPENRQSLVVPGISATHQCKGVASGISSPPNLCREQGRNSCSPENRQYDGSLLHQSDGWYPFQETNGDHISNLELEPAQENIPVSRTSSRSPECRCGSRITQEAGQLRMEAGSFNISTNHANSGPLPSGSFCLQNISSTSQIYELEAGSGGNCNRCLEPTLDEHERLCLSPVCVDRQMPIQDTEGGSQRNNTHCTSMANSAMVLSPPINVVSETTPPSETATPSDKPQQQQSSADTSVESSHVANIRDSLDHQGISSQATTLILLPGGNPQKRHTLAAGENGNSGVPHLDIALFRRL